MKDKSNLKILITIIILILGLVFLVMANVRGESFPAGAPVNFSKPCINNNTYCSSAAMCNLTVTNPFGTVLIDNKEMTNQGAFHNLTIPSQTQYGEYAALMVCCDSGFCGSQTYSFNLTPNGETPTTPKSIFYIGLVVFLLVIFGVFVYAFKMSQNDAGKMWWFSLIWLWAIGITYVGWNMARDFLTNNGFIGDMFYLGWNIMLFAFPFYIIFLIGLTGYIFYKKAKIDKLVKQGFNIDDATYRVSGGKRR